MAIVPELKEYYNTYPDWFNAAIKLSNIPKATSVHAAGTIISPIKLTNKLPLIRSKNENLLATGLMLKDAEKIGFIKYDFLAISTLGVIKRTLNLIGKKNVNFILDNLEDEKTWNLIGSKYTSGLFQIGTSTYKQRMPRLKPKTIEELAAILALVRGPCISAKLDEKYINILEGKEEIELIHPIYDDVCKRTNGILLYQEQQMLICQNIGFSLDDGFKIMKHGAKKNFDELKAYEKKFMEHAKEKNVPLDIAERIFKMIKDSALYSFNESHSAAYALLVYISAYLKANYPLEYLTSALTNAAIRKEPIDELVQDCRRLGITFLSPDINKSSWEFTIEDNQIRVGLCGIKSFGLKAYDNLKEIRPISSMEDLLNKITRKVFNKKVIIASILNNCFSEFYETRLDAYYDYCDKDKIEPEEEFSLTGRKEKININTSYQDLEKIYLGAVFISCPANNLKPINIDKSKNSFSLFGIIIKTKKIKTKNQKDMAFINIQTGNGLIEACIFEKEYAKYKSLLKKDLLYNFTFYNKQDNYIIKQIEEAPF